jgi:hypothetical protein
MKTLPIIGEDAKKKASIVVRSVHCQNTAKTLQKHCNLSQRLSLGSEPSQRRTRSEPTVFSQFVRQKPATLRSTPARPADCQAHLCSRAILVVVTVLAQQ